MPADNAVRVLVQGITGREGSFWTERMKQYGTPIVAGVTPGKGGRAVHGVPVYDSVEAAWNGHAPDTSVLFVPPPAVKQAALDAIGCGLRRLVMLAEHVPVHDVMEVLAEARERGVEVIGPNCPGIVVPGRYSVGIMPAWARNMFQPGTVGVVSRSGSLGALVCLDMVRAGFGESAFIGIGGDPIVGTTFRDALQQFEADPGTQAVVMLGEVGGTMEEDAAAFIPEMSKPVVAFIAGTSAPEGKRMGHAGAIVAGTRGSARSKIDALRAEGAHVADVPSQVSVLLSRLLGE
ncbi:MAG: succinate--CoA ligase subunit alpha [Acidobacteria bacterium]|nr:succinate--CoA ligase subunit alpha [Acidobacteriota bacterium]